jgi:hypothetical protein
LKDKVIEEENQEDNSLLEQNSRDMENKNLKCK